VHVHEECIDACEILELQFIFDLKIFSFDTSFKNFKFELVFEKFWQSCQFVFFKINISNISKLNFNFSIFIFQI